MTTNILQVLLLFAVGAFGIYNASRFYLKPEYAREYVKNNRKAYIWRKIFGEEKAIKYIWGIFAPVGLLLSVLLVLVAIYLYLNN